jgi:hypothetical protein
MSLSELQIYQVEFCGVLKANNPDHYFKAVHVYKFNASENRYLATFDEYLHHVYILQFCLEENQEIDDKFNQLAHVGHAIAKGNSDLCSYRIVNLRGKSTSIIFFYDKSNC